MNFRFIVPRDAVYFRVQRDGDAKFDGSKRPVLGDAVLVKTCRGEGVVEGGSGSPRIGGGGRQPFPFFPRQNRIVEGQNSRYGAGVFSLLGGFPEEPFDDSCGYGAGLFAAHHCFAQKSFDCSAGKVRKIVRVFENEGVDIRFYSVIYSALEEIENSLKGMLKPEYEEVQSGVAEIREVFRSSKFGNIAGVIVRSGTITRNAKARVIREGVVLADGLAIESLRRFKDDVNEVRSGFECGIAVRNYNDVRVGDKIEVFQVKEVARTL